MRYRVLNLLLFVPAFYACGAAETLPEQEVTIVQPSQEESFLNEVQSEYPADLGPVAEDDLLTIGKGTCDLIEGGYTKEDLFDMVVEANGNTEAYGYLFGSAVKHFCPELTEELMK